MSAVDIAHYRRSAPFFAALVLLAIPAFWPTYLALRPYEADWHVHVHGIALFLWSVMLIAQPWLILRGKARIHRKVGKASYVLAPVIVVSTILLAHHRLYLSTPTFDQVYFLWVQLSLITIFGLNFFFR